MPRKYIATAAPSGATSPRPRAMAAQRAAENRLDTTEADAAERLQRPVQEAHQELDPEEIEEHAESPVDAVLRLAARSRVVAHRHLDDLGADLGGERRNEAMQLAIQAQAADHVRPVELERAAIVVQLDAGDARDHRIRHPGG